MEVELSMDVVNPCNFLRKRQAVLESFPEQQKKRPCLRDSSWFTENAFNMETEKRLLCDSQSTVGKELLLSNGHSKSMSDPKSTTFNVLVDVNNNCNIVSQADTHEQMEISSYSASITHSQLPVCQSASLIPTSANRLSFPTCYRCSAGEPGHIRHLSS